MAGTHRSVPIAPSNVYATLRMGFLLLAVLFGVMGWVPGYLVKILVLIFALPLAAVIDVWLRSREFSAHERGNDVRRHQVDKPVVTIDPEATAEIAWPTAEATTHADLRPVERPGGHGGSSGQPTTSPGTVDS